MALQIQPINSDISTALKEIYYKLDKIDEMKAMKILSDFETDDEKVKFIEDFFSKE